ncbi:MAG: indole-3-glycerol phosphate synthase TrpC [Acidimicrobiia bacterium]
MTPGSATYLDRIMAAHRAAAAADPRPLGALLDEARAVTEPGRGFTRALADRPEGDLAVIAEVKRRSPSRGDIDATLEPADLARRYLAGGAAAVSVLTDGEFFGGSAHDLAAVRAAVTVPVLRKDFTVSAHDVCDARLMGADAVLLIVAGLDDAELADLQALAGELGLDALVEVHDEAELDRALTVGPAVVGVNQRDLVTFEVDRARAVRMAPQMPEGVVRVAESGIAGPDDARALSEAGYHSVLVGEALVRAADPAAAVAAMRAAGQRPQR